MSDNDNVIHVVFGPGGGRKQGPRMPARPAEQPDANAPRDRGDPTTGLYRSSEVAKLFGLTLGRLRYWDRIGFIRRSGGAGRQRLYTFQDLIALRAAKELLDQGVPLRSVRKSVEALRESLPRVARPLNALRIVADGQCLVVRDHGGSFEPQTGQLVLDFQVQTLQDDVVRVLRQREARNPVDRRAAYDAYLEGCKLDEDESTFDQAEASYRRAIQLDPALANAHTNLGNLQFRRGRVDEAEQHYQRALQVDPDQPEAYYNLGFIAFDRGDLQTAVTQFEQALESDPAFADAHFNLAMALEDLGRFEQARPHWERYLELDPSSPWSEIARRHLNG